MLAAVNLLSLISLNKFFKNQLGFLLTNKVHLHITDIFRYTEVKNSLNYSF